MNMIRKLVVAFAVLCAATVANAEDESGTKTGVRVGYSMQTLGGIMTAATFSPLGIGAGYVISIPMGGINIVPEIAFLYRELASVDLLGIKESYTEMDISVPVMLRFLVVPNMKIQAGVQADIPINSQVCSGSTCKKADGKESPFNRKPFDLGFAFGFVYMATPNLDVDVKYVFGLTKAYELDGQDQGTISTLLGIGATYYF